jgi:hypothetical protein
MFMRGTSRIVKRLAGACLLALGLGRLAGSGALAARIEASFDDAALGAPDGSAWTGATAPTQWQVLAEDDGNRFLRHEGPESDVLFWTGADSAGDFVLQGRMRPRLPLAGYSGVVFGSAGPGTDAYGQWRFYPVDGVTVISAWGKVVGRGVTVPAERWGLFRIERRGDRVRVGWSATAALGTEDWVLDEALPPLTAERRGGRQLGLFAAGPGDFDDLVLVRPDGSAPASGALTLASRTMDLTVDRASGQPLSLRSLIPEPLELLAAQPAFTFAVVPPAGAPISLNVAAEWREEVDGATCTVTPADPAWAGVLRGTLRYRRLGTAIVCDATLAALQARPGVHEVRFGFGFRPHDWSRHYYTLFPDNVFEASGEGWIKHLRNPHPITSRPGEKNLFVGSTPVGDQPPRNDNEWAAFLNLPMGVAERPERLLAFACFDTGSPRLFSLDSEGGPRGTFPVLLRFPPELKPGSPIHFQLAFDTFRRPEQSLTQVVSWFIDHAESSNPATAGAVGRRFATVPPRALSGLLNGWGPTALAGARGAALPYERYMVESGMSLAWWISAHSLMDELYPVAGGAYLGEGQWPLTPEGVRAEIRRNLDLGIQPLMYRRSWLIWENCHSDRPPYRDWVLKQRNFIGENSLSDSSLESLALEAPELLPETVAKLGLTSAKIHKVQADMNRADVREWWVKQVLAELEYYQPAGQWWDMADGGQAGIIDAMRQVREAAAERWPQMRFVGNEGMYSLSTLQTDAFAIEGFEIGGKSELCFQAAKAWGRPFFNLTYTQYYQTPGFELPPQNRLAELVVPPPGGCFALRYRLPAAIPAPPETPVVSCAQGFWRDARRPLLRVRDLPPTGRHWRTVAVPLAGALGEGAAASVAIGASSDAATIGSQQPQPAIAALLVNLPPTARLEVEAWGFLPKAPGEGRFRAPRAANALAFDAMDSACLWPSLQPAFRGDGTAVFAAGPEGGEWLKSDFRPFYRAQARGLALGALPGLGPAEPVMPALQPLFDFGRQALPLRGVPEPLAVTTAHPAVKASVWVGRGRVLVAAYNEGWDTAPATLAVDLALLRRQHEFQGSGEPVTSLLWDADAEGCTRPGTAAFRRAGATGDVLGLSGRLRPHEVLLLVVR